MGPLVHKRTDLTVRCRFCHKPMLCCDLHQMTQTDGWPAKGARLPRGSTRLPRGSKLNSTWLAWIHVRLNVETTVVAQRLQPLPLRSLRCHWEPDKGLQMTASHDAANSLRCQLVLPTLSAEKKNTLRSMLKPDGYLVSLVKRKAARKKNKNKNRRIGTRQ